MARNAILWLSCLLLLGASGCSWTETYHDYPSSAYADKEPSQRHHHDHGPSAE